MKALPILLVSVFALSCTKQNNSINSNDEVPDAVTNTLPDSTFEGDPSQVPRFVNRNYIDIDSIQKISKFRSGVGHDYSDDFESCRSMKHYFMPGAADWSTVKIFSPVTGRVIRIFSEWAGSQVHIQSTEYPAFTFKIFHVNLNSGISTGDTLTAGELIGTHISNQTMSDIAVAVRTTLDGPKENDNSEKGLRLVSFFEVMTDSLFNTLHAGSREAFQISSSERDASQLSCDGESFQSAGNLENWIEL